MLTHEEPLPPVDDRRPLCVDLDGTLTPVDLGYESLINAFASAPLATIGAVTRAPRGRQHIKQRLAELANIDINRVPINETVLERVEAESHQRPVVLVTGSTQAYANAMRRRFPFFQSAIGSGQDINCVGATKAAVLNQHFGAKGYDYVGNSSADLPVWADAHQAWVVSRNAGLVKKAKRVASVTTVLRPAPSWPSVLQLLRPHQWLKNLLLFLPLVAGHIGDPLSWLNAALGVLAFCALASMGYVVNDALDLEADRQHPRKKMRPLAAGHIGVIDAVGLALTLMLIGALLAWALSPMFAAVAMIYLVGTLSYSLVLKRIAPIDVFTLAGLYSVRVYAGGVAATVPVSTWLLTFSVFVFLSLALVKRYAELVALTKPDSSSETLPGRGWQPGDLPYVGGLGLAAAMASSVILAIYLQSSASAALYTHPNLLVLTVVTTTLWLTHLWFSAIRRKMHDDPVIFTLRDRGSLCWLALTMLIAIAAA